MIPRCPDITPQSRQKRMPNPAETMPYTRYASLDAFRGLTILLMILVNSPGSWAHVYAPLRHAEWHGCTPTDLVFPFFLFIVSSAMYFSMGKTGFTPTRPLLQHIFKRALVIFAIGLALHAAAAFASSGELRIMGVLQRIALAYLLASLAVLYGRRRGVILAITAGLLFLYWVLLIAFGGEAPYALETNAVRQLDLWLLGARHMYSIDGVAFDPEGLLSTLPAVATVLLGFEATRYLAAIPDRARAALRLAVIGTLLVAFGWAWGAFWPINKSLWTGSYVLFTAGWALVVLAGFVYLMDVHGLKFRSLQAFGLNPLFLYIFSWLWIVIYQMIPVAEGTLHEAIFRLFQMDGVPDNLASLLFAASHVVLFWGMAEFLYRRRIVIKV